MYIAIPQIMPLISVLTAIIHGVVYLPHSVFCNRLRSNIECITYKTVLLLVTYSWKAPQLLPQVVPSAFLVQYIPLEDYQ